MCCFSRPVELVADTQIFARDSRDGRQFLVYSMKMSAKEDLAMILPLPVPKGVKEDAVRFINLEKYAKFFTDLKAGFPLPPVDDNGDKSRDRANNVSLKVVDVGSFEASFVPTVKDFDRLDERFRLSGDVWNKLPQYKDFGFAVFKLKKGAKEEKAKGAHEFHPMAFELPRRDAKLFFPTVHIHDGEVHAKAHFDHELYCQSDNIQKMMMEWEESKQPAGMFMKIDLAQGLLDKTKHCYRRTMRGDLKNEDILV